MKPREVPKLVLLLALLTLAAISTSYILGSAAKIILIDGYRAEVVV